MYERQPSLWANAQNRGYQNDTKWDMLQARVEPDFKEEIYACCKKNIKLKYSVITRLIWQKILYRFMLHPNLPNDPMQEVNKAIDGVIEYIPVIRLQKRLAPRNY